MSLVTLEECRRLVRTSLADPDLQAVIDDVESELAGRLGAFQDETGLVEVTESGVVASAGQLFTRQRIGAIVSLTVGGSLVESTAYTLSSASGWIYKLSGWVESPVYTIVYRPADIRPQLRRVIIDLVRLFIERTAMKSESVAGEYSYQAPDWDAEALRILRRVILPSF